MSKDSEIDSYPTLDVGMVKYDNNELYNRHIGAHTNRSTTDAGWDVYYENNITLIPTSLTIWDETDTNVPFGNQTRYRV